MDFLRVLYASDRRDKMLDFRASNWDSFKVTINHFAFLIPFYIFLNQLGDLFEQLSNLIKFYINGLFLFLFQNISKTEKNRK